MDGKTSSEMALTVSRMAELVQTDGLIDGQIRIGPANLFQKVIRDDLKTSCSQWRKKPIDYGVNEKGNI